MSAAKRLVSVHVTRWMRAALIGISVASTRLSAQVLSQSRPSASAKATEEPDCAKIAGRVVTHPEALSGLWEAPNGKGAVGIDLRLSTYAPGDSKTLNGTPQLWQSLDLGLYEREGATIQFGEENFFSDFPHCDILSFENGWLQLRYWPAGDLDLVQQARDIWVGRLHREHFDSMVTLRRPGLSDPAKTNPVVGTWLYNSISPSHISCVHIVQQTENEFSGWSDSLQVLGLVRFRNAWARPKTALERYGERMKVNVDFLGKITLELYAFSPGCCSHTFVGTITQDGNLIDGDWLAGPNQTACSGSWTKMTGDSCVSSAPTQVR
jgi:hypothetical protein